MAIIFTVTDAGRAALVNADNNGTNAVLIASAGLSATAVPADRTLTALPGQFKTLATLSGIAAADDLIHLVVRDESDDAFTVRGLGLYLDDGTLFGVYGQADPIIQKTAASLMLLEVNVKFEDIAATSITFGDANFLNPPATESMTGIAELATQAETDAGADDSRIVTPKKLKTSVAAWLASWFSDVWRASNDGSGSGLDADLLDGQQGSWYADILARLGFTPANKAGEVFLGSIYAPMLALSGAANASFAFSSGRPTLTMDVDDYLSFDRDTNVFQFVVGGASRAGIRPDGYVQAQTGFLAGASVVWHAGNDGAGSGLDADYWRGLDPSSFMRSSVNTWLTSTDGVQRFYFTPNADTYFGTGSGGWWWQYQATTRAGLDVNGNFYTIGTIKVANGNAYAQLEAAGTFRSNRGDGSGVYYFGGSTDRYLFYDGLNYFFGGAALYVNGYLAWTSGNVLASLGSFGYIAFPIGFKIMWGTASVGVNASASITFPTSFSSFAIAHVNGGVVNATQQDNGPFVTSGIGSLGSFNVYSALDTTVSFTWLAIGV